MQPSTDAIREADQEKRSGNAVAQDGTDTQKDGPDTQKRLRTERTETLLCQIGYGADGLWRHDVAAFAFAIFADVDQLDFERQGPSGERVVCVDFHRIVAECRDQHRDRLTVVEAEL